VTLSKRCIEPLGALTAAGIVQSAQTNGSFNAGANHGNTR
jgi:hypothetical protein